LSDRQPFRRFPNTARETGLIEVRPAKRFHAAEARPIPLLEAEIADDHVLASAQVREQIELLVNDADAEALGVERARDRHRAAVHAETPRVSPDDSGDNPRQRAFSRAVFTHQRVDFTRANRQRSAP
jgi:hypothetical protein